MRERPLKTLGEIAGLKRKQPINHPWNRGYANNKKITELAIEKKGGKP